MKLISPKEVESIEKNSAIILSKDITITNPGRILPKGTILRLASKSIKLNRWDQQRAFPVFLTDYSLSKALLLYEDDFHIIDPVQFDRGDYVVITEGGFGTNYEKYPKGDVGRVVRIEEINADTVRSRKGNDLKYGIEIDRIKVGNSDRFMSLEILKHLLFATTLEIEKQKDFVDLRDRNEDSPVTTITDKDCIPVGSLVAKNKKYSWEGMLANEGVYGIVTKHEDVNKPPIVSWISKKGSFITYGAYNRDRLVVIQIPKSTEKFSYIEKTKTEIMQQNNPPELSSSPMLTQVEIKLPEQLLKERVDKVVFHRLREEKLAGIVTGVLNRQRESITKDLKEKVLETLKNNFEVRKEYIIDSFLESKRTEIFLENKSIGLIDDPTAHTKLPELIKFLVLFNQAMIVGPTGSGKSTLAKQAAKSMNLRYGSFSCNMEASKSELVGFANINGYVTSQFLDFYENGGLFLVDEYDAMSPSISVVLNAVFDRSNQISVPNRQDNPIAKKHPNFYCILAGNTWGSGSVEYQGREMQDMAFLDRFKLCRLFIDYDEKIEKHISGDNFGWFMTIRKFIDTNLDSEKFSTRSIHDATALLLNKTTKKDILEMISSHWDYEMKKKLFQEVSS